MWTYSQSTGEWRGPTGVLVAKGYSGCGEWKNNPEAQGEKNKGPIPRGKWLLIDVFDSPQHGPFCVRLVPQIGTNPLGRSGFLIHGDSIKHPGQASEGCIILPRVAREYIWDSGDNEVEVII